ncbi:MAG: hypothetical protein K1V95_03640 [Eubacterium sp.]
MNKRLEQEINRYLKEIKSNIICDFKTKRKYICDLKTSIYDFAEENHVNDFKQVYQQFGPPREIAKTFFEQADIKKIKKRMDFTRILLIGVIIALVMWAGVLIYAVIDANITNPGYYEEWIGDSISVEADVNNQGESL